MLDRSTQIKIQNGILDPIDVEIRWFINICKAKEHHPRNHRKVENPNDILSNHKATLQNITPRNNHSKTIFRTITFHCFAPNKHITKGVAAQQGRASLAHRPSLRTATAAVRAGRLVEGGSKASCKGFYWFLMALNDVLYWRFLRVFFDEFLKYFEINSVMMFDGV